MRHRAALPMGPSRSLRVQVASVANVLGAGQRKPIFLTKQQDELFLGLNKLSLFSSAITHTIPGEHD